MNNICITPKDCLSQQDEISVSYKESLYTQKPYPTLPRNDYLKLLKSKKDAIYCGDFGISLSRAVSIGGQKLYFPFIDIDGAGETEEEKISSAIHCLHLTYHALKQIGIVDRFSFIATGGTGFRALSNLLLSEPHYQCFIRFVKQDLPHITDTRPTEEMDMPHQLLVYKNNSQQSRRTLVDRHSCPVSKDLIEQNELTPSLYKQLTQGYLEPSDWIQYMERFLNFQVIQDINALSEFGKRLEQYKEKIESSKIKPFDISRMLKKQPSLSLEALKIILDERGYACAIRDRGGKQAISFQGHPCPCCGKTTSNAVAYPPHCFLKCFNVNCKACNGIKLSEWLKGDTPYAPLINTKTLLPAQQNISLENTKTIQLHDFPEWFQSHIEANDDVMITTTPGSGKTFCLIQHLLPQAESKIILYSCLNKPLQREAFKSAKSHKSNANIKIMHARQDVCKKKDELKQITDKGYSPADLLCRYCEHRSSCEYYRERENFEPGIYFVTHHMLQYLRIKIGSPDMVVIDENILQGFRIEESIVESDLISFSVILDDYEMELITDITSIAQQLAVEANRNKKHSFILNARKVTGEETDEDYLVGIISRIRKCDEIETQDKIENIIDKIKNISDADLHKKGCNKKAVMWLEGLISKKSLSYLSVSNQGTISYCLKYLVEYPYRDVPVKVIDATGDRKVVESIIQKPVCSVTADIDWKASLIHIKISINRKRLSITKPRDLQKLAEYSLDRITGTKVLLVSYKPVIKKLTSAFEKVAALKNKKIEFQSYYFHGPRGINTFEDCDAVIVVGLPYQNINSGWHDAHILFPDGEDEEYRNTWNDKCMMEELTQIIHRIRPARSDQSEIVIISSLWPSDLPAPDYIDNHSHDENRVDNAFERLKPIVKELGFFNQDVGFIAGVYVKAKEKIISQFQDSVNDCYTKASDKVNFGSDQMIQRDVNSDNNRIGTKSTYGLLYYIHQRLTYRDGITNHLHSQPTKLTSQDIIILPNSTKWSELRNRLSQEFLSFSEFTIKLPHVRNQSIKGIGIKEHVIQFYSRLSEAKVINTINLNSFKISSPSNYQKTIIPDEHYIIIFPEDEEQQVLIGYKDQVELLYDHDISSIFNHPVFQAMNPNTTVITNNGKEFAKICIQQSTIRCRILDVRVNERIIHSGSCPKNEPVSEIFARYGLQNSQDPYVQIDQLYELHQIQQSRFTDHSLQKIMDLESEIIWVLAEIELNGIGIDPEGFPKLKKECNQNNLDEETKTKFLQKINLIEKGLDESSRYHDNINQITTTGRMSCSLHTMLHAPEIRSLFKAKPGYSFVIADYKSFEARIACGLSGDTAGIQLFNKGKDIYLEMAEEYCLLRECKKVPGINNSLERMIESNKSWPDFNPHLTKYEIFGSCGMVIENPSDFRSIFKTVVLTLNNGGTEYAVSKSLKIELEEAREIIDIYNQTFPQIKAWKEQVVFDAYRNNSIRTVYGRLREPPSDTKSSSIINFTIQGNSSDGFKIAMRDLNEQLQGKDASIVHTMHDEIIVEAKEDIIYEIEDIVETVMTSAFDSILSNIAMPVDIRVSDTWAE